MRSACCARSWLRGCCTASCCPVTATSSSSVPSHPPLTPSRLLLLPQARRALLLLQLRTAANVRMPAAPLLAPALLTQGFAAGLPEGEDGAVVNLLDNRLYAANPDYFTYALSKYGLAGMTEMQAMALAPRIRVNGVAPGLALISGTQSEADFQRTRVNNPLERGVTAEERAVG